MNCTVSILIPCHNAVQWLAQTLESALAQSWTEKEIIVIDDGSTDQSLSLARSYASRGIKVIAENHRGASAARNTGLRQAQGQYIQFLDSDDLLAPDKIAHQIRALRPVGKVQSRSGKRQGHERNQLGKYVPH